MTQLSATFGRKTATPRPSPKSKARPRAARSPEGSKKLFFGALAAAVGVLLLGAGYSTFAGASSPVVNPAAASAEVSAQNDPIRIAALEAEKQSAQAKREAARAASAALSNARSRTLGCMRRMPTTKAEEQACSTALTTWIGMSGAKTAARDIVAQVPELRDVEVRSQIEPALQQALEHYNQGGRTKNFGGAIEPYIRR